MKTFNHAFTIAFSLVSTNEGDRVTAKELLEALQKRTDEMRANYDKNQLDGIPDTGDDSHYLIVECCGKAFDTYMPTQLTDGHPSMESRLAVLENAGYSVSDDANQPGKFVWTFNGNGCEASFENHDDAIIAAWTDAASTAMEENGMPEDQWDKLTLDEQSDAIRTTFENAKPSAPTM